MIPGDPPTGEAERIRRVYAAYDSDTRRRALWSDNAASRFEKARKWEAVAGLLRGFARMHPGSWVVDLGAGVRTDSVRIAEVAPGLGGIVAIDILYEQIAAAGKAGPLLRPLVADGTRLPLADASVGLVYQSTMLSSVLRADLRSTIFVEIRRVLRPGGIFLSCDTRLPNPWNRHTRPVRLAELQAGFAGWPQTSRSLTGIPQILRLLAPWSLPLCRMVEALPPLRSHRLFAAAKPGGESGAPTARSSAAARGSSAPSA
jgi:ubiquinone/menaquinone biosynthesis C-methylase UbiE